MRRVPSQGRTKLGADVVRQVARVQRRSGLHEGRCGRLLWPLEECIDAVRVAAAPHFGTRVRAQELEP
eukprot:scaffold89895_cov75-Phaeocystis_antarctica.AAC.1